MSAVDAVRSEVAGLIEEAPYRWRLEPSGPMRVPGCIFASRALIEAVLQDGTLTQVANVATLPGIVRASYAMPDVHRGYGFPIGGVAATDPSNDGVVSPGGVGFDISCGVRLLVASANLDELAPSFPRLMDELDATIPRGMGRGGLWTLEGSEELREILAGGSRYAVERGHGVARDVERCEDEGAVPDSDPHRVSERALARGLGQVGSLGSGNHFLEVQVVDSIDDQRVGDRLRADSGPRVRDDPQRLPWPRSPDLLGPRSPDAGGDAPVRDRRPRPAARLRARDVVVRASLPACDGCGGQLRASEPSAAHNLARMERHVVDGEPRLLCVHRKGATRALPPGHPELHEDLRSTGQPVLIPGSMGTASYVMVGTEGGEAFTSTAHGAGRSMSRHAATKRISGRALRDELAAGGIDVRGRSARGLAEEAPFAYKDVDEVVMSCERAHLGRRVARLRPIGVVKG